jgi:predicted amidohydrolase YtcJ
MSLAGSRRKRSGMEIKMRGRGMSGILFTDGIFHSGKSEEDTFYCMAVEHGRIVGTYRSKPKRAGRYREVSLHGAHVYPCLIDAHVHLLHTIAAQAMGFSVCAITEDGVKPDCLAGVEQRIRDYAAGRKKGAMIAASNYIVSAVKERRLPTKEELDDWGGGRPVVVYNIDGHSSSLSTEMLRAAGLDPAGHDGILSGEAHERIQGKLTDIVASSVTLPVLARGIAAFHNRCADYGIALVGALEGNGDSGQDAATGLIVRLARRFDVGIRFYFQYMDRKKAEKFVKYQKHPRIGGCGDWEMDGAVGSHSAAFRLPFLDTRRTADCYYSQEETDEAVRLFDEAGWQIASHAIGDKAVERIVCALSKTTSGRMHRIEHCEFVTEETLQKLLALGGERLAVVMQPGYAWMDRRYLHTYEQFLDPGCMEEMRLRSFYDGGLCVCGSSDSPVQDMNPYTQMLGMVDFYRPDESLTPFQAFRAYTLYPAKAMGEESDYGTLEAGKRADFFTAASDFFRLSAQEIGQFRPAETYYGGKRYRRKSGSVSELVRMMFKKPENV